MSKIVALKMENYKRIVAVQWRPKPGLNMIRGRNSQGKSSLLDGVMTLLLGKKFCPEDPVRHGADKSTLEAETEDMRIQRTLGKGEKIVVENKDTKARLPAPQAILDRMMTHQQVDPLLFVRMKPKDQAQRMRELAGLDTTDLDQERAVVFAQRTGVNRDVDTLKARVDALPELPPLPEAIEETSTKELLDRLEKAKDEQSRQAKCRLQLAALQQQIEDAQAEQRKLIEQQAKIFEDLKLLGANLESLQGRHKTGEGIIANFADPGVEAIKREFDETFDRNKKAQANRLRIAEIERQADVHETLRGQLAAAERNAAGHTNRLKEIDQEKAKRLAEAKFPIPGLSVDGDTVTLNGVPLSQASQSQQITLGFAIAAACAGELRTVLCRDGSLLDEESLEHVAAWSEENDVQVLLEVVGDGPGGIVIEDGQIKEQTEVA